MELYSLAATDGKAPCAGQISVKTSELAILVQKNQSTLTFLSAKTRSTTGIRP
jgi:hypothetical protein